ncbi:MAG: DUF4270 domain-containing protein [Bacteroidota bacterium]
MKINIRTLLLISAFVVIAISSCKKSTLIGSDLLPAGDDLTGIFSDTVTLRTKTVTEIALKTNTNSKFLLGTMVDPFFGKSTASIYTQVQTSGLVDLGNPDSLTVDSLVLNLQYAGHYGKFDVPQNISVYQLTQDMNKDSSYYSDKNFSIYNHAIGQKINFTPDFASAIHVPGDTLNPSLRIRLSDRLGQDLLNQSKGANFATNAAFQSYFKGLLIASDTNISSEGVMYLSMVSSTSDSKLTVYYHKPDAAGLKFDFIIGTSCATFNHYTHNYSSTTVQTALQSPLESDSIVYVQSMSGVKTKITLPYLKNLGNILVNKAELEITVPAGSIDPDSVFTSPARMLCLLSDSAGKNKIIPDEVSTNLVYGGYQETKYINGQKVFKYRFSITEHIQDIITGGVTDYGLYLLTYPSPEIADRIILAGGNRSDDLRMKINLIYTKLP